MSDAREQMRQSERCLRSSRVLLNEDDPNGAVNRLYYALYHAARALLMHRDLPVPKTHSGLIGAFGNEFVKSGELPVEYGRLLKVVEQQRLAADYADDAVDASLLPALYKRADAFLLDVQKAIEQGPSPGTQPARRP
ncbi:MAG TPA: HEPN domain-containing protein [Stellaceae bacterium]|nr:HEPN domain-containing protein [Stellaceae bacterium]